MAFILAIILFSIGLYAVIVKRNIVKIIIGIAVMGYAVNLLMIMIGYRADGTIPLASYGAGMVTVDPLMQAVVLTTIVIGLSMTVFLVALALRLYATYNTIDVAEIRELNG
ncbi:MAG: cation:proton antiporter subunit C [Elusimicrobia bacterium]|nr:cation:proton antiporter subunit C [Elusimicrobiota bacterium]